LAGSLLRWGGEAQSRPSYRRPHRLRRLRISSVASTHCRLARPFRFRRSGSSAPRRFRKAPT
jgi:hypothetical protein